MRTRILTSATAALLLTTGATAHADDDHGHGHGADDSEGAPAAAPEMNSTRGESAVFFVARLSGAEEVVDPDPSSVPDPDASGLALVSVKGDRVTFAMEWEGIEAPTLGHIHEGVAGTNGDVRQTFFDTPMPETVEAAAGQTTLEDPELALSLLTNPSGFYVNLHTEEFPAGAVRGQLALSATDVNVLSIIEGSGLLALADGEQEVVTEDKPNAVDPDGRASSFIRPEGDQVSFSAAWMNIAPPTLGHVHRGPAGENGNVAIELFPSAVPATVFAVSGTAGDQDPEVIDRINAEPGNYYLNLHTAEFPDGAVRGQLF